MKTQIIIQAIIGILFFCQISYFYSTGKTWRDGLKIKRIGDEKMSTITSSKEARIYFMFAFLSFISGICIILFSPNAPATLLLGLYIFNTLRLSQMKRNYLGCRRKVITYKKLGGYDVTYKSNIREYLIRGPFWLFCGDYWDEFIGFGCYPN